jgi:hypothetical protein
MAYTTQGYPKVLEKISEKQIDLSSDVITAHLTDAAYDANDESLSDISEIATGGGYTQGTGLSVTVGSSAMDGTTYKLILTGNIGFTATGTVAQFRFLGLCFASVAGQPMFLNIDLGEEVNMGNNHILEVDVDGIEIFSKAFS